MKKLNKGFTIIELMISIMLASVVVGALVYVVGESNFYLRKQCIEKMLKNI